MTITDQASSVTVTAEDIEAVFTARRHGDAQFVLAAWQIAAQITMKLGKVKDADVARTRLAGVQEQVEMLLAAEVQAGRVVSAVGEQSRALGTYHLMRQEDTTYYALAASARKWQASAAGQAAVARLAEAQLRSERVERMRVLARRAEDQLLGYIDDAAPHADGKHVVLVVTPGQVLALADAVARNR